MKKNILVIIAFSLCLNSFGSSMKKRSPIGEGVVALRVESKVFFVSEINNVLNAYKKFSCLKQSYLLSHLKSFNGGVKDFSLLEKSIEGLRLRSEDVNSILEILKVRSFIQFKKVGVSKAELAKTGFYKCFKSVESLTPTLKDLLLIEVYLRQRFSKDDGEKLSKSMGSFLKTVSRKVKYELYF